MKIYMLNMSKPRWEITVRKNELWINDEYKSQISNGEVFRYNENYALCIDKQKLLDYATNIKDVRINNISAELEHYQNMKVKVTRS